MRLPRIAKSLDVNGRVVAGYTPPAFAFGPSVGANEERVGESFTWYTDKLYKQDGVVFSCMLARQMLFSEARFAWRRYRNGQPQSLFTTPELDLLRRPWRTGTTGELLSRMIQDADLAGAGYFTTVDDSGRLGGRGPGARIARLRPDLVLAVLGSKSGDPWDIDTQPIAFIFTTPNGKRTLLLPNQIAVFSPIPDPSARWRGMSWLTPVVREIQADQAATKHKLKFFSNGATISTVVSLDKAVGPVQFEAFVEKIKAATEGVDNAYKTLYVGGGADVTLNGSTMQQLDFKVTQGAGETRIAAAAGIHPVIVGLSEGLQGSSLNAGNFQAAIRLTADKTIRPMWRMAAATLEPLLTSPGGDVDLWYDDRDVAFLRDSTTDAAAIQSQQAATLRQLIDGGFTADSAVSFLDTGSLNALEHTGLPTVQLQQGAPANQPPDPTSAEEA